MKTCAARCNIATISSAMALALLFLAGPTVGAANAAEFRVFDALILKDKPDLSRFGVTSLRIVDTHALGTQSAASGAIPDDTHIRNAMSGKADPSGMLVIDIENWPVTGDPATVANSVTRFVATLKAFHDVAPGVKYGFYGIIPQRDYWRASSGPSSPKYRSWQLQNNALQPIANASDAIFPSLYTFYADKAGWQNYATANLAEARRVAKGKPIYCFLWPQFHNSAQQPFAFLPADYWALELNTCRKHADGIVIWGGYTMRPDGRFHALPWDDTAPWWRATVKFLSDNGIAGN